MSEDLIHGGALDAMRAAYRDAPTPWIDLSTGINPWPYPGTDVSAEALTHLPSKAAREACRAAMARAMGVPAETLILAPGSELLIRLMPDVISARRVAILSPTYGDHAEAWGLAGADIVHTEQPLDHASTADVVVVTQPNNPDGRVFDLEALDRARQQLARRGGWLIIDEAYIDLQPEQSLARRAAGADGLIVLRSFGKFFGLAGVRLGAIMAPASVRATMAQKLGMWPVSGAALEIGAQAYADTSWQMQTRKRLADAAGRLDEILTAAHMPPIGGTDLYRYVEVPSAHDVFEHLARQGIYVRRFAGSKRHLRIGLPAMQGAEARLAEALSLLA